MYIRVTIKDNQDSNYKHERIVKISEDDFFTLRDYDSEDYDEAWDRLCNCIDDGNEPDDWFVGRIEFIQVI